MNQVYIEARDRVGQALYDHITGEIEAGEKTPGIDWYDGQEYDKMAGKVLDVLWAGASVGMPKISAQFSTGDESGLRGTQPVDVLKVEPNDDGTLTITINYWPEDTSTIKEQANAWSTVFFAVRDLVPGLIDFPGTGVEKVVAAIKSLYEDAKGIPKSKTSTNLIDHYANEAVKAVEANKDELLKAWMARTGIDPTQAVLYTAHEYKNDGRTYTTTQKFWVEPKPPVPDFDAVKDKRMSELTPEQRDDAMELWLRNNAGWFGVGNDAGRHIEFLLKRLDEARK